MELPPAPKKIKDTNLPKKENNIPPPPAPSSNGSADPDAKWRSNYVPTLLNVEEELKNVNVYSENGGSSNKNNKDDLDEKWRRNYVPTPYDMEKASLF